MTVRTPACTHAGLGSFPFARRYSGNRFFFLFLSLLRCFSSGGSQPAPMDSVQVDRSLSCQVSPFRNLRVKGYLLLTAAYRSLSRLSSALSAKASTLRPSLLYLKKSSKSNDRFKSDSFLQICFADSQEVLNTFDVNSLCEFASWIFRCLVKYIMAYIFLSV